MRAQRWFVVVVANAWAIMAASGVSCGDGSGTSADAALDAPVLDADAGQTDATPGDALAPNDSGPVVLGVIGDYGVCSDADPPQYSVTCPHEQSIAALVHAWTPDAIVTTGDNSYGSGSLAQLAGDQAAYDDEIDAGRFFPAMGNHDWMSATGIAPSLAYFGMKSAYYTKSFGSLVTFYVVDTNDQDDAGDTATSAQAAWLRAALAASSTKWNVVVNHQAPYSSCGEYSYDGDGGRTDVRWIAVAGADLVLSGHSHVYERLLEPRYGDAGLVPYVVIGTSGAPLQGNCSAALPGQQKAIYGSFGALRLDISAASLMLTFVVEDGGAADTLTLNK